MKPPSITSIMTMLALLFAIPAAVANDASNTMARAMITMMDAMGKIANQYNQKRNPFDNALPYNNSAFRPLNPWQSPYTTPWGTGYPATINNLPGDRVPGQWSGYAPPATPLQSLPAVSYRSPLDGAWKGRGGEALLILNGYFRIYADAEHHRDGEIRLDDRHVYMRVSGSDSVKTYEYAHHDGNLAMRSQEGRLLLYRRMPISLPDFPQTTSQAPFQSSPQIAPQIVTQPALEPSIQRPDQPLTKQQPDTDEEKE